MALISEERVREALDGVRDPSTGRGIVAAGMVTGLVVRDGAVGFAIEIDPALAGEREPLRRAAEERVRALPGVTAVTAVLTAHRTAPPSGAGPRPAAPHRRAPLPAPERAADKPLVPGVKAIVAVASGKGGVGKSTTSVNLAVALARLGLSVGLLDADVYGPSLPRMLGARGKPKPLGDKRIAPLEAWGLKVMSIGFLIDEDTPMIWRGPMVMGALEQMLREVEWGALDALIVDMPPGTGDAQLTMAQRVPLAGAIIVSTPQDIALIDARKGLNMFRKVDVPVLGIVENMSMFICPHCGGRSDIFGHGGARDEAARLGLPFLGEVPLDLAIRETSDAGTPIVRSAPDSPQAEAYMAIAATLRDRLAGGATLRPPPRIVME
ncbi:MAG: Mrp/NBP35 family ATP-binding protein [Alphaproteobacteria bacterium]